MLKETIKAIESKGYIVKEIENRWLGKLDETCPVVYEILNPDYTNVYGANGVAPENLDKWLGLPDLRKKSEKRPEPAWDATKESERKAKEKEWDETYNEGEEGYNPYR